jgi:hypothetical protein
MALKLEIMDCYQSVDLSDMDLDNILNSALEAKNNEE